MGKASYKIRETKNMRHFTYSGNLEDAIEKAKGDLQKEKENKETAQWYWLYEKAKKAIQKGGDANEILEAMSHGLMKKFIHDPLTVLRNDPNLSQEDYEKVLHLLDRFYHYHIHHR